MEREERRSRRADQTTRNTLAMELKGDRGSRRSGMWIRESIKRERRDEGGGVQSGQIQLTVRNKKREERKQKARRKETKRVVVSR